MRIATERVATERMATEAWFEGLWRVARIVTGADGRVTAAFAGSCRFAPDGAGLTCRETGVLRHAGERFPAERVTLWRFPAPGRVEVRFADGRPFHAFTAECPEAEHLCGPDRYAVSYAFGRDRWLSRWVVRGPAKAYMMTTRYRRG